MELEEDDLQGNKNSPGSWWLDFVVVVCRDDFGRFLHISSRLQELRINSADERVASAS